MSPKISSAVLSVVLAAGLAGCPRSPTTATPTLPGGGTGAEPSAPGDAAAPAAELPPFPQEPFRADQPAPAPTRAFQLPPVKRFTMGPAIEVYLSEDHDLPIVSLDLNLAGGSMNDPAGKVGLANQCMAMMTEGTTRLEKLAFDEALADLASNVSSYAGDDRQGVAMSSLKRNFAATFGLFAETLTQPGFRQAELDRMIKRSLESLKQAKASPGSISGRVGGVVLYGAKHPLGRVVTEATLGAIKLDDCKRYHASYVKPKGAQLFVAGDVTEAEIRAAFEPVLASWKGAPRASLAMPRPASPAGKIFFVNVPGAAQSSISVVHQGPARTSPHYFANTLMAQILGGGFASRINMNLREDKGYSYGARGGFGYNRFFGSFSASSSVRTDATAQSVVEIYKEVRGIKDGSELAATPAELEREKDGAILGLPASFATAADTLGMVRGLVYFGLPLDYYNHYVERVQKVALADIAAAARRELKPDVAHILVVGDGDAVQITNDPTVADKKASPPLLGKDGKQLTLRQALADLASSGKLGKGKVVELDVDGNPIAR